MNVFQPNDFSVYDNLYAKPVPIQDDSNYSVAVIISSFGSHHSAQFDFKSQVWTTLPGDDKKRIILDRNVEYWYYTPGFKQMFKRESGENKHSKLRWDEYDIIKYYID